MLDDKRFVVEREPGWIGLRHRVLSAEPEDDKTARNAEGAHGRTFCGLLWSETDQGELRDTVQACGGAEPCPECEAAFARQLGGALTPALAALLDLPPEWQEACLWPWSDCDERMVCVGPAAGLHVTWESFPDAPAEWWLWSGQEGADALAHGCAPSLPEAVAAALEALGSTDNRAQSEEPQEVPSSEPGCACADKRAALAPILKWARAVIADRRVGSATCTEATEDAVLCLVERDAIVNRAQLRAFVQAFEGEGA